MATRLLDSVCRIYKNSTSKVIAIDSIAITVDSTTIAAKSQDDTNEIIQRQFISVDTIKKHRTLLHLETSGSRVVSTIQMIGHYTSLEENSGDFLIAKWESQNTDENDVELSFETAGVAKVGDTV